MNLTRFRYFVAVAEAQSVVKAARSLRIAQPALSRQLRALEEEVGASLFDRHARGVTLTSAGLALLHHARETLAAAEAGLAAARLAGTDNGPIRVAYPDWPHRAELVFSATELLKTRLPEARIELDAAAWTISPKLLLSKKIDVGFGIAPDGAQYGPALSAELLLPEPAASAVLPLRHPLASRTSLRLIDLRDEPALIPPRDEVGELHDQMLGAIRSGGYEPRVTDAPLNFSAASQMVVAGAGWIITVNSIGEAPPPGTAVIPIEDATIMNGFFALTRRDESRPAVRTFVECVVEAAERLGLRADLGVYFSPMTSAK